jgi:DNA-binding winged helix-turn-helix (wHTH) protein
MSSGQILRFEGFTLDVDNQELRRQRRLIALPPKTFAVLQYLVEHPKRLIPQGELLTAVWRDTAVAEGLLRGYVRDIRQALGDDAAHPRFIETVPRRGFRFLPDVEAESPARSAAITDQLLSAAPRLVGRDGDLKALHRSLQTVLAGRRQVVLIAGEAGIGKTALLNAFLDRARTADSMLIACGQCVEQYGAREAYLPIFDALGALCRRDRAREVIDVLSRHAPTWLAQMPGVVSDDQFRALQQRVQGLTQTRMLRELCEALEALASDHPIILGIEDLQWSDGSTLDLLSLIARRRESARLMLIGSYRPADVIVSGHPLRAVAQDLQAHRLCTELLPDYLSESAVREYLADRFSPRDFTPRLSQLIHRNTGGNPLFVTAIVDDLVEDHSIEERDGAWHFKEDPERISNLGSGSLRRVIEAQLARLLPGEQRIVEAAAAVGSQFTADLVASALESDVAEIEQQCDALVQRRQVLRSAADGSLPNQAGARYSFSHDLYRAVADDRSAPGQRRRWYQRIAEKIRLDAGEHIDEVATELAYYFERANLPVEAALFCALAGERALRRFANSEALEQFRHGIDLLKQAPPSVDRDALELRLEVDLAMPLTATRGFSSDEFAAVLTRARDLNQKLGNGPQTFGTMRALYQLLMGRADYVGTLDLCDQLDRVAERDNEPAFVVEALRMRGISTFFLGRLSDSQVALEQSLSVWNRRPHGSEASTFAEDPEGAAASILALVLWMRGYPDQALQSGRHALTTAKRIGMPYSIAIAHCFLAMLMRFLRDVAATIEHADAAIAICDEHGFAVWRTQASLEHGWAMAIQGRAAAGIKEIRAALAPGSAGIGASGSFAKLADACLHARQSVEGIRAVQQGLEFARVHSERAWEPELHRLKGELLLQRAEHTGKTRSSAHDVEQAESCFSTGIERASETLAKSFELRAIMSLSRLRIKQRRPNEARAVLAEVLDWFTEGFTSPDLVEARDLLGGHQSRQQPRGARSRS